MVAVDGLKQLPELLLGLGAEETELVVADLAVAIDIAGSEHVIDQAVCIFQCCNDTQMSAISPLRLLNGMVPGISYGGSWNPIPSSELRDLEYPFSWYPASPIASADAPPSARWTRHP